MLSKNQSNDDSSDQQNYHKNDVCNTPYDPSKPNNSYPPPPKPSTNPINRIFPALVSVFPFLQRTSRNQKEAGKINQRTNSQTFNQKPYPQTNTQRAVLQTTNQRTINQRPTNQRTITKRPYRRTIQQTNNSSANTNFQFPAPNVPFLYSSASKTILQPPNLTFANTTNYSTNPQNHHFNQTSNHNSFSKTNQKVYPPAPQQIQTFHSSKNSLPALIPVNISNQSNSSNKKLPLNQNTSSLSPHASTFYSKQNHKSPIYSPLISPKKPHLSCIFTNFNLERNKILLQSTNVSKREEENQENKINEKEKKKKEDKKDTVMIKNDEKKEANETHVEATTCVIDFSIYKNKKTKRKKPENLEEPMLIFVDKKEIFPVANTIIFWKQELGLTFFMRNSQFLTYFIYGKGEAWDKYVYSNMVITYILDGHGHLLTAFDILELHQKLKIAARPLVIKFSDPKNCEKSKLLQRIRIKY